MSSTKWHYFTIYILWHFWVIASPEDLGRNKQTNKQNFPSQIFPSIPLRPAGFWKRPKCWMSWQLNRSFSFGSPLTTDREDRAIKYSMWVFTYLHNSVSECQDVKFHPGWNNPIRLARHFSWKLISSMAAASPCPPPLSQYFCVSILCIMRCRKKRNVFDGSKIDKQRIADTKTWNIKMITLAEHGLFRNSHGQNIVYGVLW